MNPTTIAGYYLDAWTPLVEAMMRAEGGDTAMIRAVACSYPECRTLDEALARTAKTIRNRALSYVEFIPDKPLFVGVRTAGRDPWTGEDGPRRLRVSDEFIEFLGARWAPVGAANDPTGLNRNWVGNVQRIYAALVTGTGIGAGNEDDGNGDGKENA